MTWRASPSSSSSGLSPRGKANSGRRRALIVLPGGGQYARRCSHDWRLFIFGNIEGKILVSYGLQMRRRGVTLSWQSLFLAGLGFCGSASRLALGKMRSSPRPSQA